MKQLIFNPVILSLLLLLGLVYFILGFQTFNNYRQWTQRFEKACLLLLFMTIGGYKMGLFGKFNPTALYSIGKTLPSLALQLAVYTGCLFLIASRWSTYLKGSTYFLSILIQKNPFFILHILWIVVASLLSETPDYCLKATLVCLGTTIFFVYIGKEFNWQDIFNILFWYFTLSFLLSLFYCLFMPSVGVPSGNSWMGVFSHKNALGPVMAMSAIFLYLQSVRVPKFSWLCLTLAGLAIFTLQKSQSGMAKVVCLVLISLLGVIQLIRRLPPRLAFALMGFFLAIGVALMILISENAEFIIVEQLGKDLSLTGRTYFWPLIVNAINRHPFFGYGYQGFWQPWLGENNPAIAIKHPKLGGFIPQHSHNGFLDMGLDVGWIGLAFFILAVLTNIYYGVLHVIRHKEPESAVPLVFFTWLIIANITEVGIATVSLFWVIYVLLTARLVKDEG